MYKISPRRGSVGLAALLTSTILAGTPAMAADATSTATTTTGSTQLGELIVTSNKRSENIQNVPLAIQAVDA